MEFSVKSGSPEKQRSACIVVGVFEPRRLSPIAEQLDKISDGYISALLRRGELEGKPGQTLLLHHVPNVLSERILLIGCGKERELDERQYKQVIQKTINTLNDTGSMEAVCFLTELHVKGRNNYWKVRQAVETAQETLYSFDQLKTNKSEPRRPLRKMVFNVPTRRELTSGERAIQHGLAIAAGIKAAKDLGNMPPNICNAAYLASQARQLADAYSKNVITRVIGEQQMKELLGLWKNQGRQSAEVKQLAQKHIDALNRKIADLQAMVNTLQQSVNCCAGDHQAECVILNQIEQGAVQEQQPLA